MFYISKNAKNKILIGESQQKYEYCFILLLITASSIIIAKSPTPTSSGGLQEAPQGAFNTCAPERRVSQALLLATAKKRLLHYLLFVTLLTALQYTS